MLTDRDKVRGHLMLLDNILLPGIAYPTAAAVLGLLVSLLFGRGGAGHRSGASASLGAAFATGFVCLNGWPRLPPVEATQRLALGVAVLALVCLLISFFRAPEGSRKLSFAAPRPGQGAWRPLFGFGLVWLAMSAAILENLIRHSWTTWQTTAWMLGLLLLGSALWWVLRAHLLALPEPNRRYPGARDELSTVLLRIVLLSGLAAVLGLAESALLGQLVGVVVCGAAVVDLGGWVLRRRFWRSADLSTLTVSLLGLMLISHHYAGLSVWPALLSLLALLLLPPTDSSWRRGLLPLLPMAMAIGLLAWAKLQEPEDPYDYGALHPELMFEQPASDLGSRADWNPGTGTGNRASKRNSAGTADTADTAHTASFEGTASSSS